MSFFKISKKLLAANVVLEPIRFSTSPDRYRHWKIEVNGEMAKFVWKTDVTAPLRPGYEMKDQTYDLGVDIELADAIDSVSMVPQKILETNRAKLSGKKWEGMEIE